MKLGPYYLNTIVTGDARELAQAIPDESVDLIFTDPVYDRIEDYRWLGYMAERVLTADGTLLTFYGTQYKFDLMTAVCESGLEYKWDYMNCYITKIPIRYVGRVGIKTVPLLHFGKGRSRPLHLIDDYQQIRSFDVVEKGHGRWNKSTANVTRYLMTFTRQTSVVVDFFTGGGTVPAVCKMLGRNYLAFEIDPDTAEKARARVANTQPPLFVPEHTQLEIDL